MEKEDKNGIKKPFAFVCFDVEGDKTLGPKMAMKAVEDTHEKPFKGMNLYVQPALPKEHRE